MSQFLYRAGAGKIDPELRRARRRTGGLIARVGVRLERPAIINAPLAVKQTPVNIRAMKAEQQGAGFEGGTAEGTSE